MQLPPLLLAFIVLKPSAALYVPELNQDWTLLRPQLEPPKGSVSSLPFNIGFVANPYVWDEEKEDMVEPEAPEVTKLITTTVTLSYVTAAPKATTIVDLVQIDDGQVQRKSPTVEEPEEECDDIIKVKRDEVYHIHDGDCNHEEEDDEDAEENDFEADPVFAVACSTETALSLLLQDGILRDNYDRICSIVSGHQFQCDGPVPQYGTIFAAGWSVTPQGSLALGGSTKFFQCALGDFYNIYDTPIDPLCNPVVLNVVELIDC